jgi:hypothetical protein
MMMTMKSEKDDMPKMATKSYSYGGRVAAGSMEKPEKREMQEGGMVMKPREPYTTKEAEEERKKQAMSFMPSIMKKMMG